MILHQRGHGGSGSLAEESLSLAYQRLLAHQNADGSFAFGLHEPMVPSTFLTASALQILHRLHTTSYAASPVVDGYVLVKTLGWLVDQQYPEDGSFRENDIFDGIYQRKIPIDFQEVALTAHALIALSSLHRQVGKNSPHFG